MGGKKGDDDSQQQFNTNAAGTVNSVRKKYQNIGKDLNYNEGTYDTGLYGSSTSNKNGTTWTPSGFQSQLVNYAQDNIPTLLNQYLNPTTESSWYKANQAVRQQAQNDAFENQVINPLASRNLTRGSSVNALSNMFANDVARQERQALLDESNRAGELAQQLMQYYQIPYAMMSDNNVRAMQQANMANQYDLAKAQFDLNKYNSANQITNAMFQTYMNMLNQNNQQNQNNGQSDIGQIVGALASTAPQIGTSLGSLGGGGNS